jgi:hypothetical protein
MTVEAHTPWVFQKGIGPLAQKKGKRVDRGVGALSDYEDLGCARFHRTGVRILWRVWTVAYSNGVTHYFPQYNAH